MEYADDTGWSCDIEQSGSLGQLDSSLNVFESNQSQSNALRNGRIWAAASEWKASAAISGGPEKRFNCL